MFREHSWRNLLSISRTRDKPVSKGLVSSCARAVASRRGLEAVSLLHLRGEAASCGLTHRVAVQQEEAVRRPPVLHNQIKRVGSIKVRLFLCWSRKHQVGMQ